MKYVFDSGPFIDLFRYYYPDNFPTLWTKFYALVSENNIISVREVYNELINTNDSLKDWGKKNSHIFTLPEYEEFNHVKKIFENHHFHMLIRKEHILKGKPVADPFVIAKAIEINACVVTSESYKENSANIPNVCEYFNVQCISLEEFMKKEK